MRCNYILFILFYYTLTFSLSPGDKIRLYNEKSTKDRTTIRYNTLFKTENSVKTANLTYKEILELEEREIPVHISRKFNILLDSAKNHANANSVVYKKDSTLKVTGKGVIVGVVDVGFDFTHPAFFDKKGNTRIVAVWDQGIENGTPPKNFNYGAEYSTAQEILAVQHGSQDYHSHGSHVAGIIGGRSVAGLPFEGVAPECEFIFIATPMEENQVIDAVRYVFQKAEELGKPAVVNLSLGSSSGPHDGTSLTDLAYEALDSSNKVIVTAGGNSGGHRMHISKTLNESDTLKTFVDIPWHIRELDFWGEADKQFKVAFSLYDSSETFIQNIGEILSKTDSLDTIVTLNTTDTLQVTAFSTDSSDLNGKGNIAVRITDVTKNLNRTHRLALSITGSGTIHGWNSSYSHFNSYDKPGFTDGDSIHTIIDGGGCSRGALTVGAMTSKNQYLNIYDTLKTGNENEIVGEIAPFSAVGPTIDGRQKPEIVTPGNMLIAPFNSFNEWKDSSEITDTFTVNGRTYAYGKMSGTSMATPFAAGAVALMLEVNPNLNRKDILKILKATAKEDEYTGTFTDGIYSRWGYGKFDVKAAVKAAEEMTPIIKTEKQNLFKLSTFVTPQRLRLQLRNINASINRIQLFSLRGQLLYSMKPKTLVEEIIIPRTGLAQNIVFYRVETNSGVVSGKVRF